MTRRTIPHRVIEILRCENQTIDDLCLVIYGTCTADDRRAMYTHVHRAKLLADVETIIIHTGAKVAGVPVVEYTMQKAQKECRKIIKHAPTRHDHETS